MGDAHEPAATGGGEGFGQQGVQAGQQGRQAGQQGPQDVLGAFQGLLQPHELQVLGAMGLLIGYICVFFAKILTFTNVYPAVLGVVFITLLLLSLGGNPNWKQIAWWIRSLVVIIICLLITAPQLYFAWDVSVREVQAALTEQHSRAVQAAATQSVPSNVTVTNTSTGNSR